MRVSIERTTGFHRVLETKEFPEGTTFDDAVKQIREVWGDALLGVFQLDKVGKAGEHLTTRGVWKDKEQP